MRKTKWKKGLFWTVGTLLLLLIFIYFAIDYSADKVMDKLADSFVETPYSQGQVTEGGESHPTATNSLVSPELSKDSVSGKQTLNSETNTFKPSKEAVQNPPKASDPISMKDVVDPSLEGNESKPSSPTPDSKYHYKAGVSSEKAETVKEDITFAEKTKLMTIMLKRLNTEDLKNLSDLASGGLSVEKKAEAKKLILHKLTEEEYDELIKIAKKYGLSEGKDYNDSLKEPGMQNDD